MQVLLGGGSNVRFRALTAFGRTSGFGSRADLGRFVTMIKKFFNFHHGLPQLLAAAIALAPQKGRAKSRNAVKRYN
jgi:hypothetical protein